MDTKKFQNIRFKVLDVAKGTELLLSFPQLGDCEEFRKYTEGDRNYVIRYICLAYDPQSDLYKDHTDLAKIKEAAADLAEFQRNPKTGKFEEKVYQMMRMEISAINDMIIAFLKIMNSHIWAQIQVNESIFWEYCRLLSDPVFGKDSKNMLEAANVKSKLREEIKIIATDLEVFYKQMFGDDDELKNAVKKKPVRPETMIHV